MQIEINKALEVLKNGGTILYPTDTIWGIGCDATNPEAVEKIYKIKKRTESKALISLVANQKQLEKICKKIPKEAHNEKPTTIIYNQVKGLSSNLLASNGSAGIRITKDSFCKELILSLGNPIVSTSANISGEDSPKEFLEISEEIKDNIDYIVNLRQDEIMDSPSQILLLKKDGSTKKLR
ncbi:MAG: threonylcarbamoyl-AMP synthase [Flavobacteriales bacterium]|nr:threonylcarbamoyl-AMP synthase [Flavobacteriales bacterium]